MLKVKKQTDASLSLVERSLVLLWPYFTKYTVFICKLNIKCTALDCDVVKILIRLVYLCCL